MSSDEWRKSRPRGTNKLGAASFTGAALAHTVNSVARRFPSDAATGQNAGNYLRERFGSGYLSIGLTFHHGSLPFPVEEPPDDYVEAVLGAVGLETYLLQIHGTWPDPVRNGWTCHQRPA